MHSTSSLLHLVHVSIHDSTSRNTSTDAYISPEMCTHTYLHSIPCTYTSHVLSLRIYTMASIYPHHLLVYVWDLWWVYRGIGRGANSWFECICASRPYLLTSPSHYSRYHTHTILLCHALCSTIPCPCSLMAYTIQHTMLWGVGALGMECTAHPLCSISRLHIPEYIYRCIHLSRDVYTYIILSIPLHAVPAVSCPSCVYIICLHIHTPSWCIYVAMLCVCVAGHPLVRRLRLYPDMCSRSGGARQSLGIAIPSSLYPQLLLLQHTILVSLRPLPGTPHLPCAALTGNTMCTHICV